jgi:hypothetical protein
MRENVLYSWFGGKTQREKQSGYVTRDKQKKQTQHVHSTGLPLRRINVGTIWHWASSVMPNRV